MPPESRGGRAVPDLGAAGLRERGIRRLKLVDHYVEDGRVFLVETDAPGQEIQRLNTRGGDDHDSSG